MAFVSSSFGCVRTASSLRTAKVSAVRGAHAVTVTVKPVARAALRMDTSWTGKSPPSTVLGLGKEVPSSLYILSSALAFVLGCYSVYKSNLITPLSAESVNPQFIVGSLLVPISWGLYVSCLILLVAVFHRSRFCSA